MEAGKKTWLVSAIIPVYNRPKLLLEAVDSVLAQTYRPLEIVIVDDGSTDETASVCERLTADHSGIVRVKHVPNGGVGKAREEGRLMARGEFIQYLDSDDLLLPDKFRLQVKVLQEHPEAGVAYGITRLVNENRRVMAEPYKGTGVSRNGIFPMLLVERWWNTHTPLYRRTICDAVGPWTDMRTGEDWEYDGRIGGLRTKLAYCQSCVSEHRDHTQGRLTRRKMDRQQAMDLARLIPSLWRESQKAGVALDCPEMRHFSRWAFLACRQVGAQGLREQASKCFQIALQAAGAVRRQGIDFRFYRCLAGIMGWCWAARVGVVYELVFQRNASKQLHTHSAYASP